MSLLKNSSEKPPCPVKKGMKELDRYLLKEKMQMANQHVEHDWF